MQEIKLQITPQKKSKKLYKIYTLTRVVKTTPYLCIVKLEVITSKNGQNMMAILIIIAMVANVLGYLCGGKNNIFK